MRVKINFCSIATFFMFTHGCLAILPEFHDQFTSSRLSASSVTPSSMTLTWTPNSGTVITYTNQSALHFKVQFSCQYKEKEGASLTWSEEEGVLVASNEHGLRRSPLITKFFNASDIYKSGSTNKYSVTVEGLVFPQTLYHFSVKVYMQYELIDIVSTLGRSSLSPPPHPPRVDAGCFYVHPINNPISSDSTERRVRVYWYRMNGRGEIHAYEAGTAQPIFTDYLSLNLGYLEAWISMKRHTFVFKACNAAGCSNPSTLIIPAQVDILPKVPLGVSRENGTNDHLIMWDAPLHVDQVTNYTIFWVDTFWNVLPNNITAIRLMDFFVIPFDWTNPSGKSSVEVRNEGCVGLAMSVNSRDSSSGLFTNGMHRC